MKILIYMANFIRPAYTEIKYIWGIGIYMNGAIFMTRSLEAKKKSEKILRSITEQELIPSKARRESVNPLLNDAVEVGAVNYIYQRTEWMRNRLQKHFPDQHIFTTAVIRTI